mgnify:FL=1
MTTECIFCKIVDGEIPSELIYKDDNVIAFKDLNPQAPTHLLFVPTIHVENAAELAKISPVVLGALFNAVGKVAQDRAITDYRTVFNTGAGAGQSVFHAHLHLLSGREFDWPPG